MRFRITVTFVAAAALLATVLSLTTFLTVRRFLEDGRVRSSTRQTLFAVLFAREFLASQPDPEELVSKLQIRQHYIRHPPRAPVQPPDPAALLRAPRPGRRCDRTRVRALFLRRGRYGAPASRIADPQTRGRGAPRGLARTPLPGSAGTGYGFLQEGMRSGLPDKAIWFLLAIPLVKILATSLSIGSGGSGGIFGPGMVIGGSLGLVVWRLFESAPGMPTTPAPFMVVGMISCFGAIAHAPLALMLMVGEMTGSLALLPPAMIALGLPALLVGEHSIYESQLRSRAESPIHRMRFSLPLLASVKAGDTMSSPRLVLAPD